MEWGSSGGALYESVNGVIAEGLPLDFTIAYNTTTQRAVWSRTSGSGIE